jgi:hypothetical protein
MKATMCWSRASIISPPRSTIISMPSSPSKQTGMRGRTIYQEQTSSSNRQSLHSLLGLHATFAHAQSHQQSLFVLFFSSHFRLQFASQSAHSFQFCSTTACSSALAQPAAGHLQWKRSSNVLPGAVPPPVLPVFLLLGARRFPPLVQASADAMCSKRSSAESTSRSSLLLPRSP